MLVCALLCLIAADQPKKIAVLEIAPKGVSKDLTDIFSEMLQNEVRARGHRVIGRSDIEQMLGIEKMKDALGCNSQSCLAEIGGALGVDELLSGAIAKAGSYVIITVKRIDPKRGEVIRQTVRKLKQAGDDGVVDAVTPLVTELYGVGAPFVATKATEPTAAPPSGPLGLGPAQSVADNTFAWLGEKLAIAVGTPHSDYLQQRFSRFDECNLILKYHDGEITIDLTMVDPASITSKAQHVVDHAGGPVSSTYYPITLRGADGKPFATFSQDGYQAPSFELDTKVESLAPRIVKALILAVELCRSKKGTL